MENLITAITSYLNSFELMALSLFIQKVVFLETFPKQKRRTFLILVGCITAVVVTLHVLSQLVPASTALALAFFLLFCVGFMVVPLVYSAYIGRKRYKWLAFFEFIPVVGIVDGIWAVFEFIKGMIPGRYGQMCFDLIIPLVVMAVLACIVWKKPPFYHALIRDVRNRILTKGEECVVWIVGSWLFVFDMFLEDYFQTSATLMGYVSLLNFVAGTIIIAYVINSNYRDYYQKSNMRLQKSLISTMADLVENRDENTGGHIHRTSSYVELIARKLQKQEKYRTILTDKYIEDMVIAAPLHDVGKIHIPDSILNKPGKLDAEEFATMKTHSAAGGAIISHIESTAGEIEYLRLAKEMAEYHHERMDGTGYPHGLKGEEIPLCARILAVADVFDAVSSKRCYKEAFSLDRSFAIIEEESGSHFDPEVAKAFIDSREAVEEVFVRFQSKN